MDAVSVMVVDDEPGIRRLVVELLGRNRFHVTAPDLATWVDDVCTAQPDVLLLDLSLDGHGDAFEAIPRIVVACPRTMLAVLTASLAEEMESSTLAAGAFVFYEKDSIKQLPVLIVDDLALFRRALEGEDVVAPSALTRRRRQGHAP